MVDDVYRKQIRKTVSFYELVNWVWLVNLGKIAARKLHNLTGPKKWSGSHQHFRRFAATPIELIPKLMDRQYRSQLSNDRRLAGLEVR